MNGYMVLTNGGSQPRASPSVSSRTLSRSTGDIMVNMDSESLVRKMDTIVKLDAVRLFLSYFRSVCCLLIPVVGRSLCDVVRVLSVVCFNLRAVLCAVVDV